MGCRVSVLQEKIPEMCSQQCEYLTVPHCILLDEV